MPNSSGKSKIPHPWDSEKQGAYLSADNRQENMGKSKMPNSSEKSKEEIGEREIDKGFHLVCDNCGSEEVDVGWGFAECKKCGNWQKGWD